MSRNKPQAPGIPGRRGFTLVELLVTIVILGILAGMVSGAVIVARQSARVAATKATIAKLHNILMARYESYRTRRVPIDTSGMTPHQAAQARLLALRDLMRMEMPDRWTDLWDFTNNVPRGPLYVPGAPTLYQAYVNRCSTVSGGNYVFLPSDNHYPAKCLYLIVMLGGGSDARRQFHAAEIATDEDGFSMFIDGWGRPIYFLRGAPGFNDSDLQWNIDPTSPATRAASMQEAALDDHDPFDTRRVDAAAWRLAPLIYSAGLDGEYGLWLKQYDEDRSAAKTYYWANTTYSIITDTKTNQPVLMGQPVPLDAVNTLSTTHFDNIHNHRLEMEME